MPEVADGVHRLGSSYVNWFMVVEGGKLTLVDAGTPKQYRQLPAVLADVGAVVDDIEAIVLTHAHADHYGSAERIHDASGADVRVHAEDASLALGERENEHEGSYFDGLPSWFGIKAIWHFLWGGLRSAPTLAAVSTFGDGETLDVPGRPRAIHTPGHTDGSAMLLLEERGVLFTGDSAVTLHLGSGRPGARIMPQAFNKDSQQALDSLARLDGVTADVVLPGHGEPWRDGVDALVDAAREAGMS